MASKSPSAKPAESLSSAALKTRSAIQNLQAKLAEASHTELAPEEHPEPVEPRDTAGGALTPSAPENPLNIEKSESEDELERQLKAYFAHASEVTAGDSQSSPRSRTEILDDLRDRVIDAVAERILSEWAGGHEGALGKAVMNRLVERVLLEVKAKSAAPLPL